MRKSDLSPERRTRLEPVPDKPGVFALDPPPIGPLATFAGRLEAGDSMAEAVRLLEHLRAESARLPQPDLVTRTLIRREAVLSSHIEGTRSELADLFEYECTLDDSRLPGDVRTTLAYVKALEIGLQTVRGEGPAAFKRSFIQTIHRHLMEDEPAYRDTPGQLRTVQNWVGGLRIEDARFVPPRPERLEGGLQDLLDNVLNYRPEGVMVMHVLRRAAITHAQFETLHPFRDGNGRTGRLLIPLQLAAEGYPPLYVAGPLYRNRREYFDRLLDVQLRSDWQGWMRFFAQAVMLACTEALDTTQALIALRETWRAAVSDQRSDSASRRLVELLVGQPVVTVAEVSQRLGVSFPTANHALAALVQRGIVREPASRRNRIFVADAVIRILEGRQE